MHTWTLWNFRKGLSYNPDWLLSACAADGAFVRSMAAALHPQHGTVVVNMHCGPRPRLGENLLRQLRGLPPLTFDESSPQAAEVIRYAKALKCAPCCLKLCAFCQSSAGDVKACISHACLKHASWAHWGSAKGASLMRRVCIGDKSVRRAALLPAACSCIHCSFDIRCAALQAGAAGRRDQHLAGARGGLCAGSEQAVQRGSGGLTGPGAVWGVPLCHG